MTSISGHDVGRHSKMIFIRLLIFWMLVTQHRQFACVMKICRLIKIQFHFNFLSFAAFVHPSIKPQRRYYWKQKWSQSLGCQFHFSKMFLWLIKQLLEHTLTQIFRWTFVKMTEASTCQLNATFYFLATTWVSVRQWGTNILHMFKNGIFLALKRAALVSSIFFCNDRLSRTSRLFLLDQC